MSGPAIDEMEREELVQYTRCLERKIEALEDELDDERASGPDGAFDSRDGSVIDVLIGHEGEHFTVQELVQLYRTHTDIRRQKTLKRRVKDLTLTPHFEKADRRGPYWEFVGSEGVNDE